jgi:hypothetical protein
MQLNLSNITHLLEIETSVAGNIHYQVGYTDLTTTSASNPIDNVGIITTATTTIIVNAPSATTTRKIQYLNVYNNGSSNTITIKKDILGTEYILQKIGLQSGESFRIVNDKIEVFDVSGRVKLQNNGDNEIAGDSRVIFKVGTAPEAAGNYYFFAKDSGAPGAWSSGTPGINGRNTDGTAAADLGCISAGTPSIGVNYVRDMNITASQAGTFILADVVWVNTGLVVTTTTAQTITQPTLPLRDNLGTSNGFGIGAGILVTTATTNAGAVTNMTLTYTNSAGVAGRTATITTFPATATIGTFVPFQLAQGDIGIRSIQSITLGTSLVTGAISLIAFNFLGTVPVTLANIGSLSFQKNLDLRLYNGHCLLPFWIASNTTATNLTGTIYFINK